MPPLPSEGRRQGVTALEDGGRGLHRGGFLGVAAAEKTRPEGDELASWSSQWGGVVCCVVVVGCERRICFGRGEQRMSTIRRRKGAAEQQPGDNKATTGTTTTATTKKAARREREERKKEMDD